MDIDENGWAVGHVAPLARPAFAWNHDYIMRLGAHGFAEHLGCELIAHD
jgi:hypothetical protein